ncbi:MAG: hypothetical protein GX335_06095, partial [Firmicutes bacterium]|nr:hypothetical protein [Bacillota bacterium]
FFPGIVMALVDARRNAVYAQAFSQGKSVIEPANRSVQEVLEWCARLGRQCLFVGDGAFSYRDLITEAVSQAVFPPESLGLLRPSAAAGLGYARLLQGQGDPLFSLNPIYMRKTEAEIRWQEQN